MDTQIENKIRTAASYKSMAVAAQNAGKITEADSFMTKFYDSMKSIYVEYPDDRTKKGYFTGTATIGLYLLQQNRHKEAFKYCTEAFDLIKEIYDTQSSPDNAMGVVSMANQLLICSFETEQFEEVESVYNYARDIADKLHTHFADNEQVQMILGQFDRFKEAFEQ
ncbi:MAG: hypothetical protein RR277_02805 [Rikenellaceae bacterium]